MPAPLTTQPIALSMSKQRAGSRQEVAAAAAGISVSSTHPGLIQGLFQCLLPRLSAWVEVGGIAPFLCLNAPLLQPIST